MSIIEKFLAHPAQDRASYAPFWPEENKDHSLKPLKHSVSGLTSTNWDLCLMSLQDYAALGEDIAKLAANSVESNIFLEPEFSLAGIQRVEDAGVMLLCLWEGLPRKRILRCYMPVATGKAGLPGHRITRSFTHDFAPLGTPLLHRENAPEVAEYLLRMLGDPELGLSPVFAFERQRLKRKTAKILANAADSLGLNHLTALGFERAELNALPDDDKDAQFYLRQSIGRKRSKEYARLLRRLQERGAVSFEIASRPVAVLDAIEEFLTLEARGWKGRGGTALYSLKQIAAFSRQAVSALADSGHCEIHTMRIDGNIIAGLISFKIRGEYFTWKIAFDEEFAAYSPGVQIILKASEGWLSNKKFVSADSLAAANHKMIDHLWRDRLEIGTLLIQIGKPQSGDVARVAAALNRYHHLRETAKSALNRIKHII